MLARCWRWDDSSLKCCSALNNLPSLGTPHMAPHTPPPLLAQTGVGVRLLNNLSRMQRRLLGEEELELLPFVGEWAPQAALLRDQLAMLCVLAYETKKTLWMQDTSRYAARGNHGDCVVASMLWVVQCNMQVVWLPRVAGAVAAAAPAV